MWLLFLLLGCGSDHFLSHGVTEKQIEYVYIQDNYIAGSDDTGMNEPIWVDSFQQPKISNGVDIIWVIDGSGSMSDDYQQILQGISDMMSSLPLLNWRLMITSMTPGQQTSLTSFPLLPGDGYQDAIQMFSINVVGNGESGLESLYRFIETNPWASQWMREDAALLIVFVSDEDDLSLVQFPVVSTFSSWLDSIREEVYVASIVNLHPDDSDCNNYTHVVGQRYIDLTHLYGGQIVDICSENWSQGVADASTQLQLREWLDLSKIPLNEQQIYVFVNGSPFHDWEYNATENRIYFLTVPEEESLVEIAYYY